MRSAKMRKVSGRGVPAGRAAGKSLYARLAPSSEAQGSMVSRGAKGALRQAKGNCEAVGGRDQQGALRQRRHQTFGPGRARAPMGDGFLGLYDRSRLRARSPIREVYSRSTQ